MYTCPFVVCVNERNECIRCHPRRGQRQRMPKMIMSNECEPSLFDAEPNTPSRPTRPAKRAGKGKLTEPARRSLVARGLMDDQTGATRNARNSRCQACKRSTVIGIDRDFGGMAVECDSAPLSAIGELAATILGRATYDLHPHGGRWRIDRREYWHMRDTPPGSPCNDVLVWHDCDAPALDSIPTVIQLAHVSAELPDEPPF